MDSPEFPLTASEITKRQDERADWAENYNPDSSLSPPPITVPAGPDLHLRTRLAEASIRAELELPSGVPIQFNIDRSEQRVPIHPDSAGAVAATANALVEIARERGRQRHQWGNDHDDRKRWTDWLSLHRQRLAQLGQIGNPTEAREQLVRACAVYAAHIESLDRKHPDLARPPGDQPDAS